MPQDIPATCNGCSKKLLIEHAISCPKGGLVMVQHDDTSKEWGAFGPQDLVPSSITYKPNINSRTSQGERTGAGSRQDGVTANGGTTTVGEAQGGNRRTVNGEAILVGSPVQVQVTADYRADISAHSFWKRGTTAMFDIQIVNLDAGSYLRMTPEKARY